MKSYWEQDRSKEEIEGAISGLEFVSEAMPGSKEWIARIIQELQGLKALVAEQDVEEEEEYE